MSMAVRLAALLPRAVVVALIWVLATAAFTFAADTTIIGPSSANSTSAPAKAPELVVPSVTGQAYVFAKGILEDGGFAWHLTGSVRGFSSNRVMTQIPAAGTRVVDTGAPTIVLRLVRGPYAEKGSPVATSSYRGTKIKLANLAAATVPVAPVTKPAVKPAAKDVVKPVA
jgi:beta-lactam-binding protein with PASTA domain